MSQQSMIHKLCSEKKPFELTLLRSAKATEYHGTILQTEAVSHKVSSIKCLLPLTYLFEMLSAFRSFLSWKSMTSWFSLVVFIAANSKAMLWRHGSVTFEREKSSHRSYNIIIAVLCVGWKKNIVADSCNFSWYICMIVWFYKRCLSLREIFLM